MKIEQFSTLVSLDEQSEIQKVALLAFYFSENKNQSEFTISEITQILFALGHTAPNTSRLEKKLASSKDFVRGSSKGRHRLAVKTQKRLRESLPDINESEEIISDDTMLPEILFKETRRQYLVKIAQQINSAYENNLFDACALMMRRLLEILLIHTFQHLGIEDEIRDDEGNFLNLKSLINKAKSGSHVSLSPNTRRNIDGYRELGNLSAHLITYNCRRNDIKPMRMDYRAIVEELLYMSGLKQEQGS